MNSTLYELADLRDVIDAALVASEGELTDDLAAALDAWEGAFADKVESVALYICDIEGDAAKIKAEEDKLAARRTALANRAKSLRGYLLTQLERAGVKKVDGTLKTVALRNSSAVQERVACDQEDMRNVAMIAPTFIRRVPERFEWDKDAVKIADKAGALPEDVAKRVTVAVTTSLQIR